MGRVLTRKAIWSEVRSLLRTSTCKTVPTQWTSQVRLLFLKSLELYQLVSTCTFHAQMPYCPVLVKVTEGLQKYYDNYKYLLQIWDEESNMVSQTTLKCKPVNLTDFQPRLPSGIFSTSFLSTSRQSLMKTMSTSIS